MTRVVALVRMRIAAYVGLQRVWPPLIAALALVSVAHAGGVAPPNQAYAFSAALLLGVFGWQTKLVLDTEPDEQRLLAKIGVGSPGRELAAGLLAALVMVLPVVVLGVVAPLLVARSRSPAVGRNGRLGPHSGGGSMSCRRRVGWPSAPWRAGQSSPARDGR
ncbi:hypothetical protein ABN028_25965 [Actinopolymorpha sp. B17G11]|uniref:hypothetical protein n=1 Tax=Actinopolymorpha sp. B17G11 TaxID=3160861 RepID=UPI0032E502D1